MKAICSKNMMNNILNVRLINFNKPWWYIILQLKWLAAIVLFTVFVRDLFWTLVPFLIAFTLEKGSWYFFSAVCGMYVLVELNSILTTVVNTRFQLQCIHSVTYSAHYYLLMIDPHYHVKRSSGVILGKINRAARGYEDVLDQITYEFMPLVVSIGTMIIILSHYSFMLVGVLCACLGVIVLFGYYYTWTISQRLENEFIKTDDDCKAIAFESLSQIHLIRATFATEYILGKLKNVIDINSHTERKLWLSYTFAARTLGILYSLSILIILGFLMHCVHAETMSLSFSIGLILAYIQSTNRLLKILGPLRRFMRGLSAIKDLFKFMPECGKQTISILEDAGDKVKKDEIIKNEIITVEMEGLVFKYDSATIFDSHNLRIETKPNQVNKLYGIIGPSGVGKTTLLSILGGQLKPLFGTVVINSINIYEAGDTMRRQLIALQGQIATSTKGTIRYNLLFGLPKNHGYTDEYVCDVMRRVGLFQLLSENQGLDTFLGEGALNISGGQRQRLNFAGLYLRARYYKPALILIDEPTSSLDEISEEAITHMIHELALDSITLVIAHRLKTLKNAVGLIDLSLLIQSKEIRIYTAAELKEHSVYYQRLLEGKVAL